ncbi:DUF642 domain-containing protein [Streptomyces sp. ODS28]|uniref:DUF642 domain-containing protein n=1 Tax=Streptomyces sp. ODS28 TaxID=3136688 RepID=UPI0031E70B55
MAARLALVTAAAASLSLSIPAATATPPGPNASRADDTNLVKNPKFESEPMLASLWSSNAKLKGWRGIGEGYDLLSAKLAKHPSDIQAVDLGPNFTGGGIQQDLKVKPNTRYDLIYQHSPDAWVNCTADQDVSYRVEIANEDGDTLLSKKLAPRKADGKTADWVRVAYTFRVQDKHITLRFVGNKSYSCQAAITNVRVRPEK